jgi:hypothetical protein
LKARAVQMGADLRSETDHGEVLRDFTLNPTRDYQPTGAPKGPKRKKL